MSYDQWKTRAPEDEPHHPNRTEPPQQWFVCDVCDGDGVVPTGRMSHSVDSATIDPPFEITETCPKCGGACGWIDDVEDDAWPSC